MSFSVLVAVTMDERRLFVETDKYLELYDLFHHRITKRDACRATAVDLKVKPEESHDTVAMGILHLGV